MDSVDDTSGNEPAADSSSRPAPVAASPDITRVWVLSRKTASGEVESLRVFDDEARARADLELVQSVSADQFWLATVPIIETRELPPERQMSRVQALALEWLADGAEAEGAALLDDTVQVRPLHVRGFLSVPPEEWRQMEEKGWVRNGLLTPEGAEVIGR